jgi:hypothetical protein
MKNKTYLPDLSQSPIEAVAFIIDPKGKNN